MENKNTWLLTSLLITGIAVLGMVLSISAYATVVKNEETNLKLIENYRLKTEIQRSEIEELNEQLLDKSTEVNSRDILLTAYHTGDGSSGVTTASGLSIADFQTNELGWYTYQDKVVLATSNTGRMNLPLFDGYASHNINDTLDFELDGTIYQGIVLDVCGACYGVDGETEQRYDIFTNGAGIGKKQGVIYE